MCEPASSSRCHSETWKHLFDILTTSKRGYQQHLHPQYLDTYQPRKKTLQAPYSIMHSSHHTHHHHPLQQVTLSYTHPHSSEPPQCLINLLIHQLNPSQVRSPEPACILDFQAYSCSQFSSEVLNLSIKGVPWHYPKHCISQASGKEVQAVEGHPSFMPSYIQSESLIMTLTTISDAIREGRMINLNTSLWVLREWNDRLDMNEEIANIQNP